MFNTPYDTTAMVGHTTDTVRQKIMEDYALNSGTGAVRNFEGDIPNKLYMVIDGNALIPLFEHPVVVNLGNSYGVVADMRGTVAVDRTGKLSVRSMPTYEFNKTRLSLQRNWLSGDASTPDTLVLDTSDRQIADFPCVIFSRWVSETLTRRLGLTIDTQLRVQVLSAFHYISMHKNITGEPVSDMELVGVIRKIQVATRIPPDTIAEIVDQLPFFKNVGELMHYVEERTGSPRLEGIDVASLFSFLKGSWSGRNPSEVIAVAMEYPPLFMAMCYMGLKEPGFKSTNIGTLCKMEARNTAAVAFIESVQRVQG